MGLIPALNSAVTGTIISSSEYNSNMDSIRDTFNTYAVLTDVAKTITVQHTFGPASAQAPFLLNANAQGQLVTGLNADQLDGEEGSFYRNASNINAGTLAVARLPSSVVLTDSAKTITAQHSFSPGSAQAPFILGANAQGQTVTGLDADTVDGSHASAFALSGHTHPASDIVSGTIADARLPSTLLHTDIARTVTATITFSHGTASTAPFAVAGNSSGVLVSGLNADLLDGKHASEFVLTSHTHPASDITSGTFSDARIAQSNVTQHEGALTVGASQLTPGTFGGASDYTFPAGVISESLQVGSTNGASITGILSATVEWDIPLSTDDENQTKDVTVTGAAVGDLVYVEAIESNGRAISAELFGYVSSADTVRISWTNQFGSTIDPNTATYRVLVFKF